MIKRNILFAISEKNVFVFIVLLLPYAALKRIILTKYSCNTVKPVYNGHSLEKQNVAVVGR